MKYVERRAVGIDPGTKSFDICGIEGDRLFLDKSIPASEVGADPHVLVDLMQSAAPLDMVVGPSGYGLPWVNVQTLSHGKQTFCFSAMSKIVVEPL